MSQVTRPNGIELGSGMFIFAPPKGGNPNDYDGAGDPTQRSNTGANVVALGSIWLDKTNGKLWVKVGPISPDAPAGVWEATMTSQYSQQWQ